MQLQLWAMLKIASDDIEPFVGKEQLR